ncbi:MAG: hypothetical protein ACJ762_15125 [Solirubrobacteraceae bacterium]
MRTLYKLAERVEGSELVRVHQAIAKRRSELALEETMPSALAQAAAAARPHKPLAPPPFEPGDRDSVPRLIRRPGERKNRIAPPE